MRSVPKVVGWQLIDSKSASLICTVKNENKTISDFLVSLKQQSIVPNEIVIVDGGSSDGTIESIQNYMHELPIKLILSKKCNIASGRNLAIRNSSRSLIVSADAGCKLHRDYFKVMLSNLGNLNVDVVGGIYLPWTESESEQVIAELTFPRFQNVISDQFLPSSRSIAFKKSCWESIGGYPEWLDTAEDSIFDMKLKNAGFTFVYAMDAIVYWRARSGALATFKQYLNYSIGNGMSHLLPWYFVGRLGLLSIIGILFSTGFVFPYFWILIPLLISLGLYLGHIRKLDKITFKRLGLAIAVSLAIEAGTIIGYAKGLVKRFIKKSRHQHE